MGRLDTLQTEAQRKKEGSNIAARVTDTQGNELLSDILEMLRRIEFQLSSMTNFRFKD